MNPATATDLKNVRSHFVFDFQTERKFTPEGYLVAPAKIARTGIQVYSAKELGLQGVDADKKIRLYRPPEEVFNPDAMASFESTPTADNHPPDGITSSNWRQLATGDVHDVQPQGQFLTATVFLRDQSAIDKVIAGKTQLSCGYQFDCDLTPGTTADGQAYDGVQRRIRGNHVATVDAGRAGREVRIADAAPSRRPRGRDLFLHRQLHGGADPEPTPALRGRALFLHRQRFGGSNP